MAFKRVLKAKTAFKKHSAKLSPEVQKEWEDKYTEQGLFQLREQTAHCNTDRESAPFSNFTLSWKEQVLEADLVAPTTSGGCTYR